MSKETKAGAPITEQCKKCGGRTALVGGIFDWQADHEPYQSCVGEAAVNDNGQSYIHGYVCDSCGEVQELWNENLPSKELAPLEGKELSEITDEDAIEVAVLINCPKDVFVKFNVAMFLKDIFDGEKNITRLKVYQYLASKGYKLPVYFAAPKVAETKFSHQEVIDFTMAMISQYVQGNTNIWNRELLMESLQCKIPVADLLKEKIAEALNVTLFALKDLVNQLPNDESLADYRLDTVEMAELKAQEALAAYQSEKGGSTNG